MISAVPLNSSFSRRQNTLKKSVSYSGTSVHTGKWVSLTLSPAPPGTGIVFHRSDCPESPEIPAQIDSVVDTQRSTTIGRQGFFVSTVEHLCSALRGSDVDNARVEVSDQELPIGDGSARIYQDMIETAGIEPQGADAVVFALKDPVTFFDGESYLAALPSEEFRVSYTLHYPNVALMHHQFVSFSIDAATYKSEIAPCRTFSLYEELKPLLDKGLIKGGSLENSVVIKDGFVMNDSGLRFSNEMARHKVLDLIGDLSLMGCCLKAHIIGYRTGHKANVQFGKELLKTLKTEELQCLTE